MFGTPKFYISLIWVLPILVDVLTIALLPERMCLAGRKTRSRIEPNSEQSC